MGRIVATEFISLDGVVEDPGGSEDFEYGGWSFEISRGEEGDKFKLDEILEDEAGFAETMNAMPKYVVSSTLTDPTWANTTVLGGDLATEAARLKDQVDGDILVAGSVQLVQGLLEHDQLDELHLMVYPVVLGAGKRLFGETSAKKPLRLTDNRTVGDGIAVLTYVRA